MILFPIAFLWLLCVMVWIIRNSLNEPDSPPREPRRWLPRPPRRTPGGPRRGRPQPPAQARSERRASRES
jgi:hypothetical protein